MAALATTGKVLTLAAGATGFVAPTKRNPVRRGEGPRA
jgi:hypothetical protein